MNLEQNAFEHDRAAIPGLGPLIGSCRRRWPTDRRALRSTCTSCLIVPPIKLSTVDSRALPVAAAHYCWLYFIIITADFSPSVKNSSFSTFIPSPDFWPLNWHHYRGPCSKVRYLGHSENLCLLEVTARYVLVRRALLMHLLRFSTTYKCSNLLVYSDGFSCDEYDVM